MGKEIQLYASAIEIRRELPELHDQYDYHRKSDALRRHFKDPKLSIAWLESQVAMAQTVDELRKDGKIGDHGGDHQGDRLSSWIGIKKPNTANVAYLRWSALAAVPDLERARYYATAKMPSRRGLLLYWERKQRRPVKSKGTAGIMVGDFREQKIADASVALIFTDPPYARKDAGLYTDLAKLARRVLIPGGSLIAYSGQVALPAILGAMSEHLRFWWVCACVHRDKPTRMMELGILNAWKPLIWLVNGGRRDRATFIADVVSGGAEKADHDWQQPEAEAAHFIEALTMKGETVLDPMCGSGTTLAAAKALGRQWVGYDSDADAVASARSRLV